MVGVVLVYNRQMPHGDCCDRTYPATFKDRDDPQLKQAMAEVCQKFICSDLRVYDANYQPKRNMP